MGISLSSLKEYLMKPTRLNGSRSIRKILNYLEWRSLRSKFPKLRELYE